MPPPGTAPSAEELRFARIANAAPVMLWTTDAAGRFNFLNRSFVEFLGLPLDPAMIGLAGESLHPEDAPRWRQLLDDAEKGARPMTADLRWRRSDGETRWVQCTAAPLFEGGGAFVGHSGSAIDVTARKAVASRLKETSDRLEQVVESMPEALIYKDGEGRWLMANRAALTMLGLEKTDWRNRTDDQIGMLRPQSRDSLRTLKARDDEAWARGSRSDSVDGFSDGQGLFAYFEASRVPLYGPEGERRGLLTLGRNATERRLAEDALQLSASVFEQSPEGIMITDAALHILRVNRSFTQITGYTPEEVLGRTPRVLRSGKHEPAFYALMWKSIQSTGGWRGEIWNRRKSGEIYPEWLSITAVRDTRGEVSRYVATFSDIAEQKRADEERKRLALKDALTGLANRPFFEEAVTRAIAEAELSGQGLAVILLDVDRFARINHAFGFEHGDEALRMAARRLDDAARSSSILARWSADAFAVMLPLPADGELEHRVRLVRTEAHLLQSSAAIPFLLSGQTVNLTASAGIAVYPEDGRAAADLMRSAETALVSARDHGPATLRFHTPEMEAHAHFRKSIEDDIVRALDTGGLVVHYQPIVDARTGAVHAAEALLRIRGTHGTLLRPSAYIEVAEETGLISRLGSFIMREACRQLARWQAAGLPIQRVAVNVSSRQLRPGELIALVEQAIDEAGIEAKSLEIEITEGTLLHATPENLEELRALRKRGVQVSLDDFGTGFSALSYLKRFDIDALKIDRTFVAGLPDNVHDMAITRAILSLARGLGLRVVTEGVETERQAAFVTENGTTEMQGHYISAALSGQDFLRFLAARGQRPLS